MTMRYLVYIKDCEAPKTLERNEGSMGYAEDIHSLVALLRTIATEFEAELFETVKE